MRASSSASSAGIEICWSTKWAMPACRAPGTSVSPSASSVAASGAVKVLSGTPWARAAPGVSRVSAPPTVKASAPRPAPFMKARRSMSCMVFASLVPACSAGKIPPEIAPDGRRLLQRLQKFNADFGIESSAVACLLRQGESDMQLAQLLGRDLGRRAHHQVLGALVHRKEYDFAQVLFAAEQHHDAVDAGRDAAVGRRAERKRMQHAAEFLFERVLAVAGDGKRLAHDVGAVIADGAGGQLDAVADDVVLDRLDGQDRLAVGGIEREEVLDRHVRHGERVVGEVYSLLLLVPFIHGEIDDPAEFEAVLLNELQVFSHLGSS